MIHSYLFQHIANSKYQKIYFCWTFIFIVFQNILVHNGLESFSQLVFPTDHSGTTAQISLIWVRSKAAVLNWGGTFILPSRGPQSPTGGICDPHNCRGGVGSTSV